MGTEEEERRLSNSEKSSLDVPLDDLNMSKLPVLEVLGRAAAELQGSEAGMEFGAQGSLPFMGGTEGGVPHGSTGAAGLGEEP